MAVESDAWRGEHMKKTGTTTVRYETRTTIDRPIGDVFALLADLDGYRTWMHRTGLFRRSSKPLTVLEAQEPRISTPREWAPSADK